MTIVTVNNNYVLATYIQTERRQVVTLSFSVVVIKKIAKKLVVLNHGVGTL